ncbi:MAG: acyl-CoA transferase [Tabrizicola sp.]
MTTAETVLAALASRIAAALPPGAVFQRNGTLPVRIPATGAAILRDGEPGEAERLFSPPVWYFEHEAELDLVVEGGPEAARLEALDVLRQSVAAALAADRSLGGLVDWCEPVASRSVDLAVDGGDGLRGLEVRILLAYAAADSLG